ncbi:MAG: hypothetical protein R2813_12970 [Flavobacteriales bacterium]
MEIQEGYTLERYSLLKQMLSFNPGTFDSVYAEQYLNEYNNVKTLGIKTDRFGIGFGGALAYNNETWVSVSISYKSGLSRSNVKRNYERCSGTSLGLSTSHQSKYAFAISLLRANLKKGVTSLTNDVSISLIQITSPVYLNPVEFGVKWGGNTLTKPSFYYQPGIGIGWRIFSLGYSYDFLFTKEARASFSPHVVSISVIFPVTDTHNPKRYLK